MNLTSLELKNFKSFEALSLRFTNLNILAGANSVGKSTVIQALLLIKQNRSNLFYPMLPEKQKRLKVTRFEVNGELVNLGNETSLLYIEAQNDEMSIAVGYEECLLCLSKEGHNHWQLRLKESGQKSAFSDIRDAVFRFDFHVLSKLSYLSTNRIQPQIIYPLSGHDVANHSLGIDGRYTAHYLALNARSSLNLKALKHPNSKTPYLLENVSYWLAEISENVDVTAKVIPEANQAAITYSYAYGNNKSREITPLNVGFGVTHALPVVTLLLMAKEGDTLIIENPEAHLHPSGQANLAKLISLVASQNVQVVIETHSDHILNGVRVATKEGIIQSAQSKVYFFEHEKNSLASKATEIAINSDGSVNQWPSGFFDEWDNQLDKLLW